MKYRALKYKVYHESRENIEFDCLLVIHSIRRWDKVLKSVEYQINTPLEISDGVHNHIHSCLGIKFFWGLTRS